MNQIDAEKTVTLSICMMNGGTADNVIPERVYVGGTARFFDREEGEKAQQIINKITENTAACDHWYASESYSRYLEQYPGALGFLGIRNDEYGSGAAHHNEKFDVDESVLPLGVCAELAFLFQ